METFEKNAAENALEQLALKKVKRIKNFYIHAFIYIIGVTIYVLKTYYGLPFNFFPIKYINGFVMAIWTFSFVVQAVSLFITEIVLGKKWEQNKMKNIINKESQKETWE
jgi:high-affinity Fe2+/Pb2+ permease